MLKRPYVFVFLLMAILLAACGGMPTNSTPNPNDKTPPLLSSSLPANAASAVPINVKLAFNFNEVMDENSLELSSIPAINLDNPIWNAGSTGVAFDNASLAALTPYALTLKAKDISGNVLAETIVAFTTSDTTDTTAPTLPTGLVATPGNGRVVLTWQANTESDLAGYTVYMGTVRDKLESIDFVTTTSKTLTGLTNGTAYFFAVDAVDGAANKSNETAPVSATPSATTIDTTPPTLQSSNPADGATDVRPRNPSIKLVFSEPMDTASLSLTLIPPILIENIVLEPAAITPFEVSWSEADTVATLTLEPPAELLLEETTFTLAFSVKDKAGNTFSGDNEINFTTGFEVPTLVSSIPADGASDIPATDNIILGGFTEITLTFSEGVDLGRFEIDANFPYACLIFKSVTVSETVRLGCPVYDGNTYRLDYKGQDLDLHDFSGSISFSTVPDTVAPIVLTTSPTDLAVNISLATPIFIRFNDEMDETSTLAAVSSSPDVGCAWELNPAKDTLFCDPANLQGNTTYTIIVAETATDTSGKNLIGAGVCRGTPPCSYEFMFSTIATATTGSLSVNISGLPATQNRVRVTGPNGYNSGLFDSSTTFSDLIPGDYIVTATSFVIAPGKPACRIYTPTPASQTKPLTAGSTATVNVSYTFESCALPDEP